MTEVTARFALPLLQVGQAQKEVTHNEAVHRLDRFLHLVVSSRTIAAPPSSPTPDALWIVAAGASDAWEGHDDELAAWTGEHWSFQTPPEGTICWIADETIVAVYGDGAWQADFLPVAGLRVGGVPMLGATPVAVADPAGGGIVDTEARAAIAALLAYLRTQGLVES